MAIQAASAVAITGGTISGTGISGSSFTSGTINNTVIGQTTPLAGSFTDLSASGTVSFSGNVLGITTDKIFGLTAFDTMEDTTLTWYVSGSVFRVQIGLKQFQFDATGIFTVPALSSAGALTFSVASAGPVFKLGSNGRAGTVTLTGTTAVTISNTSIATSDLITFSLATVGGTVGAHPIIKTITPSTGFTVAGSVSDTSTYNYGITKIAG